VSASRLSVDAGFLKTLPLQHPYMRTFVQYRDEFGGANRVLVALVAKGGDIFTPGFFHTLEAVTDSVFFMPGVERGQVRSLFTPNVRFVEVVEGGFAGGDVVPSGFEATPEDLARVRENVLKSGQVGRLVANDFSAALVSAQLIEVDPATGERLDYLEVARRLEEIRTEFESDSVSVHILGFAKVVGNVAAGARGVVAFFGVALLITAVLVRFYARSWRLAMPLLLCSVAAVVWQLGLLPLLGFGIDPMSLLVPFLVLAIGVSHGVQMVTAFREAVLRGAAPEAGAREAFRRLLVPGSLALVTDVAGFLTMLVIGIRLIQDTAIIASLGLAVLIVTNLLVLPLLLARVRAGAVSGATRSLIPARLWTAITALARPGPAAAVIVAAAALFVLATPLARQARIGDLQAGVPELRPDSRYNLDVAEVISRFSIGVDVITVIAETAPEGCIDHTTMDTIDRLAWRLENVEGVHSTLSLPGVAKVLNAGWNEGSLKWRVLPRDPTVLAQSVSRIETATGLLNADCTAIPIMVFTEDHKAETIDRVLAAVRGFDPGEGTDVRFRLAAGNVGVMAATNESVRAAQFPMLLYIFAVVIVFCLLVFRSLAATACIVVPLALTSVLGYALMALTGVGLKVFTLPVIALGTGIGVDYGIYVFASARQAMRGRGLSFEQAMASALRTTGNAVLFTGLTLAVGVSTWIFSALQFQADMGLLLTFMFLVNMVGAVALLPALATWVVGRRWHWPTPGHREH